MLEFQLLGCPQWYYVLIGHKTNLAGRASKSLCQEHLILNATTGVLPDLKFTVMSLPGQHKGSSGSVSAAWHVTRNLCLFLSCSFYKSNYVQKFHYSRPVRKGTVDPENEFAVSISPPLQQPRSFPQGHLYQPEQAPAGVRMGGHLFRSRKK